MLLCRKRGIDRLLGMSTKRFIFDFGTSPFVSHRSLARFPPSLSIPSFEDARCVRDEQSSIAVALGNIDPNVLLAFRS